METIITSVTHELAQLLLVLLMTVLTAVIGRLYQRFNLERLGLKREQMVTDMRGFVLSFEEQVEAAVKKGVTPAIGKGGVKLELALAAFMKKHPQVDQAEATVLAHEAVATVGVGAADFLAKLLHATRPVETQ